TGGAVNLNTVVLANTAGGQGLAITAGNGAVTLGNIGNIASRPLAFLTVATTGQTTINGSISTDQGAGTGNIDFSGATGGIVVGTDVTVRSDNNGDGASGVVNLSGSAITTVAAGGLGLTVISGDGDGTNAVVLGQVGSLTNPLKF